MCAEKLKRGYYKREGIKGEPELTCRQILPVSITSESWCEFQSNEVIAKPSGLT